MLASAGIETGRFGKGYLGLWKLEPVINQSIINQGAHTGPGERAVQSKMHLRTWEFTGYTQGTKGTYMYEPWGCATPLNTWNPFQR